MVDDGRASGLSRHCDCIISRSARVHRLLVHRTAEQLRKTRATRHMGTMLLSVALFGAAWLIRGNAADAPHLVVLVLELVGAGYPRIGRVYGRHAGDAQPHQRRSSICSMRQVARRDFRVTNRRPPDRCNARRTERRSNEAAARGRANASFWRAPNTATSPSTIDAHTGVGRSREAS